ncbi:MAG: NTP/NDP exchange transporter [Sphingobacteriia bacterium]|nr:NTP/NDP exchange transporter [Sphingobacteriia bacterium]
MTQQHHHFSKWRAFFWPIHNYEMKKFMPLAFIMFCLLFNYTMLRDIKDTLVVNSAGASMIPFLKLYCVTPAAVLFVVLYIKLSNAFDRENLFYVIVTPFLIFFGLFGFLIYPNVEMFHPAVEHVAELHKQYPNFSGFIDIYGYWTYSLFYVMAEIWGSAMVSLLFWQFANQVTRMTEAKRFYGLFAVIGNIGLIFSGQAEHYFNDVRNFASPDVADPYLISLKYLMTTVVLMGVGSMLTYRWMHKVVLTNPVYYDESEMSGNKSSGKKKKKPGLMESAKIIFTSPELGLIAILIIAYGVSINLAELQWKHQLKLFYAGDKNGYNSFMGNYSTFVGIFTILFILGIGNNVLRALSWFGAAVITPLMTLLGGSVFFMFILGRDGMMEMISSMKFTPIAAAAFLGAAIIMLSKAIKYSLFDPTKEMAYIPLDEELKSKGKAAVDVLGGRIGKAGGAFVQQAMFIALATKDVIAIAPYTFGIFAIVCVMWLVAVKALSKRVNLAMKKKNDELKAAQA